MGMKRVLEKEEFEGIQEPLKTLYTETEGKYVLELEDYNPENLLSAKRKETEENAILRKKNKELQAKADAVEAAKASDLERAIAKANEGKTENDGLWQKKVNDMEQRWNDREGKLKAKAERGEIERVVNGFNGKWLPDSEDLGSLAIRSRVKVEYEGDEPKAVFLDKYGEKTLMTEQEFRKNIFDEPSLKNILKGNTSSGSGASQNSPSSATRDISKLTGLEMVQLAKENPSAYQEYINNKSK